MRRRDLAQIAYIWTMSNGSLARRLGRFGWLLLPVSFPIHLIGAGLVRRSLIRHGRAVIIAAVRGERHGADPVVVLAGALACAAVWLPVLAAPLLLPGSLARPAIWLAFALCAALVVDVVAGPLWRISDGLLHGAVPLSMRQLDPGTVHLTSLAAYPRGQGHGEALMRIVASLCDDMGVASVLELGSSGLAGWYERFGYRTTAYRQMRREPRPR